MANKDALKLLLNKKVLGIATLAAGGVATALNLTGKEVPSPVQEVIPEQIVGEEQEMAPVKASIGTIENKLKEQGVNLLGNLNSNFNKWEVIMAKYQRDAFKKGLVMKGGMGLNLDNLDVQAFSGWCIQNSEGNYEGAKAETLELVKEYCSVPKTKDYLAKDKKQLMKSDSIGWSEAVKKYVASAKTERMTIAELGTNVVEPEVLKDWCTENSEGDYEEKKYGLITSFCTENIS